MPIVKSTVRRSSAGSTLAGLVVLALVVFGVVKGLNAFSRWSTDASIKHHEDAVEAKPGTDESTVVLVDKEGAGRVYYKLGHGQYADALRKSGIGCRAYEGGAPYTFEKLKTTDPIPFDKFPGGTMFVGECDVSKYFDHFDLAQAQK